MWVLPCFTRGSFFLYKDFPVKGGDFKIKLFLSENISNQPWPTFYSLLDLRDGEKKWGGWETARVAPSMGCPIKGGDGFSFPIILMNIYSWEIPSLEKSIYSVCSKGYSVGFHSYWPVVKVTLQFPHERNMISVCSGVIYFCALRYGLALFCLSVFFGGKVLWLMSAPDPINYWSC